MFKPEEKQLSREQSHVPMTPRGPVREQYRKLVRDFPNYSQLFTSVPSFSEGRISLLLWSTRWVEGAPSHSF